MLCMMTLFRIDSCIGVENHRDFFFALLLFVVSGFYGAHLTMTTVCAPEIYLDWFLWPADCQYAYSDFPYVYFVNVLSVFLL